LPPPIKAQLTHIQKKQKTKNKKKTKNKNKNKKKTKKTKKNCGKRHVNQNETINMPAVQHCRLAAYFAQRLIEKKLI
jgi:hypothetical protein